MDFYGTLGPGCAKNYLLKQMYEEGMTGVRLNLSHGSLKDNAQWIYLASCAAASAGTATKILIDLQGPELRIGTFAGVKHLKTDSAVVLGFRGIPVPETVISHAKKGMEILMNDGKIKLRIIDKGQNQLVCHVERGGELTGRKSITLPEGCMILPTLTKQDGENLAQAKTFGVTGVMLPFVRNREDLEGLREALSTAGIPEVKIFAKIENRSGVLNLPDFVGLADEIVIARGDLGNAVPLWELPSVQKQIADMCLAAGKPYMVVTQMLNSMESAPVPTRAEVSDIYRAVSEGASSLMLTGETAAGMYPVQAMSYLVKTAKYSLKNIHTLR